MIVFWLAIAMALVGAVASLLTPRAPTGRDGPADLVTREAELIDGISGVQPLTPTPRIAGPLAEEPVGDRPRAAPRTAAP